MPSRHHYLCKPWVLKMILTYLSSALLLSFLVWYYLAYNDLVSAQKAVEQSWSNIEVELKRRFDLIENLVAVVKGYAEHERKVFSDIAGLRTTAHSSMSPEEARGLTENMSKAIFNLVAISEAYPDLKASENFQNLSQQLIETENRISQRRNAYNQTVNLYKNRCEQFPGMLVAGADNFSGKGYFDAPDSLADSAPKVQIPS